MGSLRVGFDGRALSSPAGGVRRYASQLLRALVDLAEPLDLVILGGADAPGAPATLERIPEPWHPPTNLGWTAVGLPQAARNARVDLLHSPAYTAPPWAPVPVVLTIHDVSYARHPEWFPYRRDALRRAFYRRSALAASRVITDSTFSASEIQAAYGIPSDRLSVIPLGIDPSFAASDPSVAPALPAGVTLPFVLHVGDLHERRNLLMVLEAVLEVRRRFGALPALSLVLAGVDRGVGQAICGIARRAGAPDAVVLLGAVEEEPLRHLYRRASALVYPSLYEGFGLPLLEAMASGTPVIASRAASLPEVVGDAGILLDPHDATAWATAIMRVVGDDRTRGELTQRGLLRASEFPWERTARATLDVYRQALMDVSPASRDA